MMGQKRGNLLYIGITGRRSDNIKKTRFGFLTYLFGCVLSVLIAIGAVIGVVTAGGSALGACVIAFLLFAICLPGTIAMGGLEVDAIYENGVTHRYDYLFRRLTGKSFHRFKNITKIGFGRYIWRSQTYNFVLFFENNSILPTCHSYNDKRYKNDFYERLIEIIKVKCPQAKWEEVDFFSFPKRLR